MLYRHRMLERLIFEHGERSRGNICSGDNVLKIDFTFNDVEEEDWSVIRRTKSEVGR